MRPCAACKYPSADCLDFCPQIIRAAGSASGWWEDHVIDWSFRLIERTESFTDPAKYQDLLRWLTTTHWR